MSTVIHSIIETSRTSLRLSIRIEELVIIRNLIDDALCNFPDEGLSDHLFAARLSMVKAIKEFKPKVLCCKHCNGAIHADGVWRFVHSENSSRWCDMTGENFDFAEVA